MPDGQKKPSVITFLLGSRAGGRRFNPPCRTHEGKRASNDACQARWWAYTSQVRSGHLLVPTRSGSQLPCTRFTLVKLTRVVGASHEGKERHTGFRTSCRCVRHCGFSLRRTRRVNRLRSTSFLFDDFNSLFFDFSAKSQIQRILIFTNAPHPLALGRMVKHFRAIEDCRNSSNVQALRLRVQALDVTRWTGNTFMVLAFCPSCGDRGLSRGTDYIPPTSSLGRCIFRILRADFALGESVRPPAIPLQQWLYVLPAGFLALALTDFTRQR